MGWVKREPMIKYHQSEGILDKLLKIRGIKEKNNFLNPVDKVLHSSKMLKNIDIAAEAIIKSLDNDAKICVSGDV
jgi:hypothetical protein